MTKETGRVPLERAREVRENNAVRTRGFGRRENVRAVLFQTEPRHASIFGFETTEGEVRVAKQRHERDIWILRGGRDYSREESVRRGERRVCGEKGNTRNWNTRELEGD